jgi:hypothetical protein
MILLHDNELKKPPDIYQRNFFCFRQSLLSLLGHLEIASRRIGTDQKNLE